MPSRADTRASEAVQRCVGRARGRAFDRVSSVLFCPFCRESFEGERVCPEHELSLVPWSDLPKPARKDDEPLARWSPALGRGALFVGALGTLLSFATLPLASTEGTLRMGGSMLKLALLGSPKLWLVTAGALTQLAVLLRRRTPFELRRARIAVLFAALVPPLAGAWAFQTAQVVTAQLAAREGEQIVVRLDLGGYALIVCAVLSCVAALRLGGPAPRS
jgi:hypothetical protein